MWEGTSGECLHQFPFTYSKQGQLELSMCPEYYQGWRLYHFSGQPVTIYDCLQSGKKNPYVKMEFHIFSLCPGPLVFSLGTTK